MVRTIDDFSRPIEYLPPFEQPIKSILRKWADKEVIPYRRRFDEDWEEHRLVHSPIDKLLGEYGIQRLLFPQDMGGMGLGQSDYLNTAMFMMGEEVARADSGIAVVLGVTIWPLMTIALEPHVNRRLLEEFAPMYCDTTEAVFGALAMTEPQGGSDIENVELTGGSTIQTTAVQDGDEWVINGHKLWPSNTGGVADLFGVVCTTNPGSTDPRDIALILVPADVNGVTQSGLYEKAGMAADKNGDIWFENVRVPLWYRAHGPGEDAMYFGDLISIGNGGVVSFATGTMMNIYERLLDFVNRKKYRGRPLKENDAVAGVLADFAATIEALRILGYQAARMLDRSDLYGDRWSPEIMAKMRAYRYFAMDRCLEATGKVMNLMEAYGADRDWDVEKHWRDIKMNQLWLGGKQLCQMEVARWFYDCETI
jgi:alkylation response protein AidB-like acyl-CoA dehydrogenase